jgi:outer membrane receptor for ferrienterochelin and colicin
MKNNILTFFFYLCYYSMVGQTFTITGLIQDKETGESLSGASITTLNAKITVMSNNYGYYAITVATTASDTLMITLLGYKAFQIAVSELNLKQLFDIRLEKTTYALSTVEIQAAKTPRTWGENVISKIQIRSLPALLGEKDALKVIQLLPGVQRGNEGNSGLYVRGGTPDQNLILLDEAPVYNLNHFFGLFSVFNGDAIKDLRFYKGNIPARYGGRLSSVSDFVMCDGDKEKWKMEGGIGLLSSRLMMQGPLLKERSSILFAARRSYFDILTAPFLGLGNDVRASYFFHDYNLKANYRFNKNNYLILSGYFGRDKYNFSERAFPDTDSKERDFNRFFWYNTTGTLRWNHIGSKNTFVHTALIFNKYRFNTEQENINGTSSQGTTSSAALNASGIQDIALKQEWMLSRYQHSIRFGAIVTHHLFTPTELSYRNDLSPADNFHQKETIKANESAFYAEDKIQFTEKLDANLGIRLALMNYDTKRDFFPEPRFILHYNPVFNTHMTMGYTRTNQFLQLLSNTGVSLPTDFWVPSTQQIRPQQADQYNIGFKTYFEKNNLELSIDVYHKTMRQIAGYREGSSYINLQDPGQSIPQLVDWRNIILQGKGYSTGLEVLLEKKGGNWTGWIAYTLSKTKHQFNEINQGKPFYPFFDRRHTLNLVSMYKPSSKVTFSATWIVASPNPVAIPVKAIPVMVDEAVNYLSYYGERGQVRERWYHRLDIGMQFHKQKTKYIRTWEISIYNVYNRKNPFLYALEKESLPAKQERFIIKAQSIFMFIPNIAYNFSF